MTTSTDDPFRRTPVVLQVNASSAETLHADVAVLDRVLLGAAPHCDVVIPETGVPVFAVIVEDGSRLRCDVLPDQPPAFLNGKRVRSADVAVGNVLSFCGVSLSLTAAEEVSEHLTPQHSLSIAVCNGDSNDHQPVGLESRPGVTPAKVPSLSLGARLASLQSGVPSERGVSRVA